MYWVYLYVLIYFMFLKFNYCFYLLFGFLKEVVYSKKLVLFLKKRIYFIYLVIL